MRTSLGTRLIPALFAAAAFIALPTTAGVSYRVSGAAETVTWTTPDPTAQPPGSNRHPLPPRTPKRTVSGPIRLTAEVFIEGPNIRINNFRYDDGRGGGARSTDREVFVSRDGGASFDIINFAKKSRTRFPLELSLNPVNMMLRAFSDILGAGTSTIRVDRKRSLAGEKFAGYQTTLHQVQVKFDVEPNARFRREKMRVSADLRVWTTPEIEERVPSGLHAWTTGFAQADVAAREKVRDVTGFPIRAVTDLEMKSGRSLSTTRSTLEITDITIGAIDSTLFEVREVATPPER